ncbi:MAG: hypothetical protein QM706_00990 [Nitrospira sp.]
MIKADDDKWISVGVGVKAQFTAAENQAANGQAYSKDFGIVDALIYLNGRIHKYIGFEFNTECFNCSVGGGANSFGGNSSIGLIDAILKLNMNEAVNLWVGRMLVTGERTEMNGPFFHGAFDTFKMPLPPQTSARTSALVVLVSLTVTTARRYGVESSHHLDICNTPWEYSPAYGLRQPLALTN